jgi:hypothetical protein
MKKQELLIVNAGGYLDYGDEPKLDTYQDEDFILMPAQYPKPKPVKKDFIPVVDEDDDNDMKLLPPGLQVCQDCE